jgi:hypothetical protein
MGSVRLGDYFEQRVNYEQPVLFTNKDFYNFRNHVLRVLRRFGSAGPMGEADLSIEADDEGFFKETVEDPDFFVVDDIYNDHDRLSIVECDPAHINAGLINSLTEMTRNFPGWWVSFSLGDSGLFVSSGAVLLGGRRFWDCNSVQELGVRCAKPVDFGPQEPFSEAMYVLWIAVISGKFDSNTEIPSTPSRQWAEVIRSLQKMLKNRKNGCLTSFDYAQVRNDLHPYTRRQFLLRLLAEISEFPVEQLTASKTNIQNDSGQALAESKSIEEMTLLGKRIFSGLAAVVDKLDATEVVSWWANVLHGTRQPHVTREPSEELARVLKIEMRNGLGYNNPLVQLSSTFGLARLHASDIALIVDEASGANPEWSTNLALIKWLQQLKTGSTAYPDRSMLKSR